MPARAMGHGRRESAARQRGSSKQSRVQDNSCASVAATIEPSKASLRVNLRSKDTGWSTYSVDIRWPYGKSYTATNREDPYIRAFVGDLCLRPSCYRCSCKGLTRCADFTLGDYWGVWDQAPSLNDNKGTSIVLVHSAKARALWEEISADMTVLAVDSRSCMDQNPAALRSALLDSENRALFLHRYDTEDFAALVEEILPKPSAANDLARRVAGKLKRLLKI